MSNQFAGTLAAWLSTHGLKIAVIVIAAFVIRFFSDAIIRRIVASFGISRHLMHKSKAPADDQKRIDTLNHIFTTTFNVLLVVIAGLMVISELGFAVGPLLAAAGIAGLAFGFGGQYLIKDLISGLFIIIENQYRIGDVVCFGTTCGAVEDISLRKTTLRDMDGTVYHVPHGSVTTVSNLSKDFARVNLNIGVAYGSDLDKVIGVVNKVGNDLAHDPAWKDRIRKAPQFLRVDDFGESAVTIKILGETVALAQWDVTGELRKRIKAAFDKEKIEIPFPQRVMYQRKG